MDKTVFVLLVGGDDAQGETDAYQNLQKHAALSEGRRSGIDVEVAFAPGFDQLRSVRKRLADATKKPVDAVITEPASLATMELLLRDLKGKTGLVLLNAWAPAVEESAMAWGSGIPFGTVSTDHKRIGEIQGRQISVLVPRGGHALCVTGPQRSSAAQQRLEGTRSTLRPDIRLLDAEAAQWTEAAGLGAFNGWYGIFKARSDVIHVVAGQSDELAVGAMSAFRALKNTGHREMFSRASVLGVDACPGYGRRLVDEGSLKASIVTPPNTGMAIQGLLAFWNERRPLKLRAFTEATAYPPSSVPPS
jgi:ABC-type sugar transport system substrate-binding protein